MVPVGFTWEAEHGWANITSAASSVKVRNATGYDARPARGALCQVDGGRWITLEGALEVVRDPHAIARAVQLYTVRYSTPEPEPDRVLVRLHVDRVMSSDYMA